MQKPRCPRCKKPARALYEREGTDAVAKRVPGWAKCPEHGPFKVKADPAPPEEAAPTAAV